MGREHDLLQDLFDLYTKNEKSDLEYSKDLNSNPYNFGGDTVNHKGLRVARETVISLLDPKASSGMIKLALERQYLYLKAQQSHCCLQGGGPGALEFFSSTHGQLNLAAVTVPLSVMMKQRIHDQATTEMVKWVNREYSMCKYTDTRNPDPEQALCIGPGFRMFVGDRLQLSNPARDLWYRINEKRFHDKGIALPKKLIRYSTQRYYLGTFAAVRTPIQPIILPIEEINAPYRLSRTTNERGFAISLAIPKLEGRAWSEVVRTVEYDYGSKFVKMDGVAYVLANS
jgi:hypothetical protein